MLVRIVRTEGISGAFKGFSASMINTFSMRECRSVAARARLRRSHFRAPRVRGLTVISAQLEWGNTESCQPRAPDHNSLLAPLAECSKYLGPTRRLEGHAQTPSGGGMGLGRGAGPDGQGYRLRVVSPDGATDGGWIDGLTSVPVVRVERCGRPELSSTAGGCRWPWIATIAWHALRLAFVIFLVPGLPGLAEIL